MTIRKALGQALRSIRTTRGLTQEDFSDVSSRTYLSTLERGLKSPTLDKLEEIASTLNVHPLSLIALAYANQEQLAVGVMLDAIRSELDRLQSSD